MVLEGCKTVLAPENVYLMQEGTNVKYNLTCGCFVMASLFWFGFVL